MAKQIIIDHVFKVFGDTPQEALRLVQQGLSKQQILERTGHSIGEEVHGNGANIDNLETPDSRLVMARTCFSIEPGIYLPGDFGLRSEIDVYVGEGTVEIAGQPIQTAVIPILQAF